MLRTFVKTLSLSRPSWQAQNPAALKMLAGLAGLNVFIYFCTFTERYNLFELYRYHRLTLFDLAEGRLVVYLSITAAFIVQAGLYWLGWRTARQVSGWAAWGIALGGAIASAVALLFVYPFDAADIFDNIMRGRILGIYQANPFQLTPRQFPTDPFYRYAAWNWTTSAYGPLWEILAGITARLAGNGVLANILAFKLLVGLFWLGSLGLIAAILRRVAPERALAGVLLLAWNPLVLYETFGNGHNDITLVFWLLAATWALVQRRYTLAILALLVGALFKFIPVLLLPAATFIALRQLSDTRARWHFMIVTAIAGAALVVIAYAPFWEGAEILTVGRRSRLFTASLPAMFYTWFKPAWGFQQAAWMVSLTAAGLTAIFALWQGWRAGRDPSWLSFSRAAINILLFYLLFTCPWFQHWYAIWPLGLAALLPPGPQVYLTLLLGGYTLIAKHLVFGPLFFKIYPLSKPWREIWFGPAVLALPWLYAFYTFWGSRQSRPKKSSFLPRFKEPA